MQSEADLERRAEDGEAAAQFELGRILLTGPRAAVDGLRGVQLVDSAAAAGEPEALAMSALFDAMGVGRVQSWERALGTLQRAAEAGSDNARRQLLLLSAPDQDPALPAAVPAGFWSERRSAVDLARLFDPGERQVLSESPRVRVIPGFATAAECRWLIGRALDRLERASVIDQRSGRTSYEQARSNRAAEFQLPDMDLVVEMIRSRISAATRVPVPVFEPVQVLHYDVGQEFLPHFDYFEPGNPAFGQQLRFGQRIATFLIYLNGEFEGGETEFPDAGIRYRGNTGDAIFWANVGMDGRPDALTRHAGLPPTAGQKWILSQWIRDRAGQSR